MRPERFHRLRAVLDRRQPDLTVLLERVHKEHNVSAILRNCDAVGVLDVHAVAPREGLKVHRDTSGGTGKWMRMHTHPDAAAAATHLRGEGFRIVAAHPGEGALDFRDVDYTRPTAILMGAELFGVSEDALSHADDCAAIPMVGMVRSLNVSVASSLFLYEAYRQREAAGLYASPSRLQPERYRTILFEWAHPTVASALRARGVAYPDLGPDGELPEGLRALVEPPDGP